MRPHRDLIYQLDPSLFRDGEGHGWGTLDGVSERLDHLAGLGTSVLWLQPFYLSGDRDGGYDVVDHCRIDPRLGTDDDFDRLVRAAESRGMRVIVELVMQHTSDLHPWFQQARASRSSPYRGYYIWQDDPDPFKPKPIFPPVECSAWRWDAQARQYYRHHFYAHEPDLELAHPQVRAEMERIMTFWLDRGVAGFRVDAAPYMVERAACADATDDGLWLLESMRSIVRRYRDDGILVGEADVGVHKYADYLAGGSRLTHVLDFHLNNHLFLALAREDAGEISRIEAEYGPDAPASRRCIWLRNHDELDLEQLSETERGDVIAAFAPLPSMRIYRRGIRRRLASMLEGDTQRIAMAYALILSLGQPAILRYGEEIGMGDEPELPERNAVRTPMQWHDGHAGGFTEGPVPFRASIDSGPFGYRRINVAAQQDRPDALLERVRELLLARRSRPAFDCAPRYFAVPHRSVLVASFGDGHDALLALINLSSASQRVRVPVPLAPHPVVARGATLAGDEIRLDRYGYGWFNVATRAQRS